MQAHDIFRSLKSVFPHPAHTLLSQVRNGTGFTRSPRTADALAVSTFPSRGLWLAGIEIKLYLGDWKRELANGEKAEAIHKYCHYWYVAAPEGLIPQAELPETWGLIEVGKKTRIVVKSVKQDPKPIDMLLLGSILRNVGESCVPMQAVEDMAKARAEKLAERDAHDLKSLRQSIADFKASSGIDLAASGYHWDWGDIGKAVKIVRNSGITRECDLLQKLRERAEEVSVACRMILDSVAKNKDEK